MGARLAARRHREELGGPVSIHRDRPGALTVLAFVLVWAAASALTLIAPDPDPVLAIAPAVTFAVLIGGALMLLSGEVLIVCERGLIVGSVAPFLRPYVIRYDQIVPGSVAPVGNARRYGHETETQQFPQSTVRRHWWTRSGVHFVGPSAKDARRHHAFLAPLFDPPPRSIDERWVWFVGTGRDAVSATAAIARAAGSAGLTDLAQRTAQAAPRDLTGDPADVQAHLPGHHPLTSSGR